LTERGRQIKADVENVWQKLEIKITQQLTETEKLIFLQLLEKILLYFYNDSKEV
jgi:DNA-binding MarR family transcriptional regulator